MPQLPVDTVLGASTPRAFVPAFNALLKHACPKRTVSLVVMTADTFHEYPDLRSCTFLERNYWTQQKMQGGLKAGDTVGDQ